MEWDNTILLLNTTEETHTNTIGLLFIQTDKWLAKGLQHYFIFWPNFHGKVLIPWPKKYFKVGRI